MSRSDRIDFEGFDLVLLRLLEYFGLNSKQTIAHKPQTLATAPLKMFLTHLFSGSGRWSVTCI